MSSPDDLLHLRWNNFESNIKSGLSEIRSDEDFFDVTLACDSKQIKAHKVILSACSPFFRTLLKSIPHQHPLLYLRGIQANHLESLLCFIYNGEVSITQGELNNLLSVAEELQIKGFTSFKSSPNSSVKTRTVLPSQEHEMEEVEELPSPTPKDYLAAPQDPIGLANEAYEDEAHLHTESNYYLDDDDAEYTSKDGYERDDESIDPRLQDSSKGVMILSDEQGDGKLFEEEDAPEDETTWTQVQKKGLRNVTMWPMFDISGDKRHYRCMACRKRFKVTSSPSSVKRHLFICRRGAFYKAVDRAAYVRAARRGDFL